MEKPHKKLDVWKAAMKVAQKTYQLTKTFPEEEKFGLVSQMRRAAVSIPCNIAEGAAYLHDEDLKEIIIELVRVDKMLSGLIRSLKRQTPDA
jgi:hypothetical protein